MRIHDFQKILLKKNVDFALFLNTGENKRDKSIFYFAGVDPEFACLIIPKKGEPKLVIAKLEEEIVKKESKIRKIVVLEKKLFEKLKEITKKPKNIGIDFAITTLAEKKLFAKNFKKAEFVDISKEIAGLRVQKSDEEIKKIRKACDVTDKIFSKIVLNIKKFKNEKDVEELIEKEAKMNGCTLSFPPIVASGKNSSMPHYEKNSSKLKKGFLVLDFGVKYKGYCSDMTRTIYIGKPSQKEADEYYRLLGVQEEAIRSLKAGADFKKIDEGVRKVLGKTFIHSLGHGLGIDVHEALSTDKKRIILKENSVLTVEPGVYHPGRYGIRIEDDILITKKGCEVLTKSRKELIVIR